MAASNRDAAIKVTLGYEGGYSNHPADPGGPTNWGITLADARKYWKADADAADVKAMPVSVAINIYRLRYWATGKISCDAEPAGVDFAKFDYRVNSGIGRADPALEKVRKPDPVATVKALYAERMAFLKRLKIWPTFKGGWTKRCVDGEARGVKMALSASVLYTPADVAKKLDAEGKAAGTQAKKEAAKAGGTVAAPSAGSQTVDMSSVPHWALWVIGFAMAVAVVWFTYRYWINRQRAAAYVAVAKEP